MARKILTGFGQRASRAVDQLNAKRPLQISDVFRDGRLADTQFARRPGKRLTADEGAVGAEGGIQLHKTQIYVFIFSVFLIFGRRGYSSITHGGNQMAPFHLRFFASALVLGSCLFGALSAFAADNG